MSHIRLFEHPAQIKRFTTSLLPLQITGTFVPVAHNLAYSDYVTIINASGPCAVELISGSLPPGSSLYVDNDLQRAYITWPAASGGSSLIANGNFEAGDSLWNKGPGWTIEQNAINDDPTTPTSAWTGKFDNVMGESILRHTNIAPIPSGTTTIVTSCRVQQGDGSAGSVGAAVRVYFYDASMNPLTSLEGNYVNSNSFGEWKTSSGSLAVPALAAYAQIACRSTRVRDRRALWVDNFLWNLTQPSVGAPVAATYPITIRVTDSIGRQVDYSQTITVT